MAFRALSASKSKERVRQHLHSLQGAKMQHVSCANLDFSNDSVICMEAQPRSLSNDHFPSTGGACLAAACIEWTLWASKRREASIRNLLPREYVLSAFRAVMYICIVGRSDSKLVPFVSPMCLGTWQSCNFGHSRTYKSNSPIHIFTPSQFN